MPFSLAERSTKVLYTHGKKKTLKKCVLKNAISRHPDHILGQFFFQFDPNFMLVIYKHLPTIPGLYKKRVGENITFGRYFGNGANTNGVAACGRYEIY